MLCALLKLYIEVCKSIDLMSAKSTKTFTMEYMPERLVFIVEILFDILCALTSLFNYILFISEFLSLLDDIF